MGSASSYKSQSGDADADVWGKGCAEGEEAGVEGAAGGVDVVYQQEVLEGWGSVVSILAVMKKLPCNSEGPFDIAGLFIDIKARLSFGAPATPENIAANRYAHCFRYSASNDLCLIISPLPLSHPM